MKREVIGLALIGGIILGIVLDTWIEAGSAPIVYANEQEVVLKEKVVQIRVLIDWTEDRIKQEIETQAQKYGVSADQMARTIQCESHGSTTIQSMHVKNGIREQSFGLAQIHLPAHPHVSKEEAQDPQFAIEFMAKRFAQGQQRMWTCWRNMYL